jgi:hypothetical protein
LAKAEPAHVEERMPEAERISAAADRLVGTVEEVSLDERVNGPLAPVGGCPGSDRDRRGPLIGQTLAAGTRYSSPAPETNPA